MIVVIVIIVLVVLVLGWLMFTYNRLVRLRNETDQGFSGIDIQLKRRADLIPNLVESVKAYAAHERGLFEELAKARASTLRRRAWPARPMPPARPGGAGPAVRASPRPTRSCGRARTSSGCRTS